MATLLHQESRRMYSWWWDSHISPKSSKWLQENLTDMDAKVKAMIKLIEEDADSFARRAEMYYKKRPELMKLVEEFYRAYRALAERYNHATGELRQAHRTMAEAFPCQVPYVLSDDSTPCLSGPGGEPHTPEMPHPIRALLYPDDLHKDALGLSSTNLHSLKRNGGYSEESESGISKRGLKQLNEMFGSGGTMAQNSKVPEERMKKGLNAHEVEDNFSHFSSENRNLKTRILSISEHAGKAESEVESLKKSLAEIEDEKEAILLQYQQSLQKVSSLERELNYAQKDAGGIDERASKTDIEIKVLKEALLKIETERDAGLLQYNHCLERICTLETMIFQSQKDSKGLDERASKAEIEAQNLKQELSRLEAEKEAGLLQYKQCLEMIHSLELKISLAEENARMLNEQTERAETEVEALKQALARLNEEKEAIAFRFEQFLEKIAHMESEIFHAQEDAKRLKSEILTGAEKLRTMEQQCVTLERSNQSLQEEADRLVQKIAMKDQELSQKQKELENLQASLQDEHSRFFQVEATLQALQNLHSQSQEERQALTLELQNNLQTLKDLDIRNHGLEEAIQQVKEENQSLIELNNSSSSSIKSLQNEISCLKELKEKLEKDIALQVDKSNTLQLEVHHLKEEIMGLSRRYEALVEQVLSVGLNPGHLDSSVRELQDENSKLKEVCKKQGDEKKVLHEKLRNMDNLLKKNATLECSLSEMNGKLEGTRESLKELRESCQFLREEKSSLLAEKSTLLSQLQIMTENMQKLLEKNILTEKSLTGANVELEGLQAKAKSLEDFCRLLNNEKSNLLNERSTLVSKLANVEKRLGNLDNRFTKLEEKYANLEKEKESTLSQVEELRDSLNAEQQERAEYVQSSESRMEVLENLVHLLQQETRLTKKEFEEELDKAVKAQVEIFILQKFIKDLEEKNLSLLIERQKHVEASKLSDKLIQELETENLEQQIETEFLFDELEKLRAGIYQVFKVLQFDSINFHENKIEQGQIPIPHILDNIEDLKGSLIRNEDEKQQLLVENSVLLTLIGQLRLEGDQQESEKKIFEQELMLIADQRMMLQRDKDELLEMNKQLMLEVREGVRWQDALKAELETQNLKFVSLQGAYLTLQEENYKLLEEDRLLLERFLALKEEMSVLEEENSIILPEALDLGILSMVFKRFGIEKAEEVKALTEDLNCLRMINSDLKEKAESLEKKLEMKEAEGLRLNETVDKLHMELHEVKYLNDELNNQIFIGQDSLRQKTTELLEAELKLKATHNLNAEFCKTVEDLKRECKELKLIKGNLERRIFEILGDYSKQKREIKCLHEENKSLESEVGMLCEEIEEQKIKEVYLSLELQERSNEFELWEAEATSFYFDLQISSTREILLENKVHELTKICESLEDERAAKHLETRQMQERVGFLESEIGQLKSQLSSYVPVIASLQGNIASLEQNVLHKKKRCLEGNEEQMGSEISGLDQTNCQELEVKTIAVTDGISELQEMQTRIEAVEKALVEEIESRTKQRSINTSIKVEGQITEAADLKLRSSSYPGKDFLKEAIELKGKFTDSLELEKSKPETSELRNRTLMKDIPLDQVSDCSFYGKSRENGGSNDQMLGLWECSEQDCSLNPIVNDRHEGEAGTVANIPVCHWSKSVEPKNPSSELEVEKELGVDKLELSRSNGDLNKEGRKGKILERLASDAQKLTSLQSTVQELKKKMELNKRSKRVNDPEYESIKRQLKEIEEAVTELAGKNDQLTKDTKGSPSTTDMEDAGNITRNEVTEEARKGSEKIGRLQLEVQSIEYILLKLEDENKTKMKYKFSESKKGALLRDFIYSGGRSSGAARKKACFCGCTRPSTNGD